MKNNFRITVIAFIIVLLNVSLCLPESIRNLTSSTNNFSLIKNAVIDSSNFAKGKVVGLDYYYNFEWRKSKNGKEVQFHYIWKDTANSGYSKVGEIIKKLGASLGELHKAPTFKLLSKFSIYIIIDRPEKLSHPIKPEAIGQIAKWVKGGGILMLIGNNKGNAEFTYFNNLAGKFGIHFIEDSRNDVQGRKYYEGEFNHLPVHPIFKDVSKIYMKGICTLKLKNPAEAILKDKGDVIIAYSKYGRGGVFAVGDPWFYNEYIYHKYLPAEYENGKAASNLFKWLLKKARVVKPKL